MFVPQSKLSWKCNRLHNNIVHFTLIVDAAHYHYIFDLKQVKDMQRLKDFASHIDDCVTSTTTSCDSNKMGIVGFPVFAFTTHYVMLSLNKSKELVLLEDVEALKRQLCNLSTSLWRMTEEVKN